MEYRFDVPATIADMLNKSLVKAKKHTLATNNKQDSRKITVTVGPSHQSMD